MRGAAGAHFTAQEMLREGEQAGEGRRPEGAPTPPPGGPLAQSQTPAFLGGPCVVIRGPRAGGGGGLEAAWGAAQTRRQNRGARPPAVCEAPRLLIQRETHPGRPRAH